MLPKKCQLPNHFKVKKSSEKTKTEENPNKKGREEWAFWESLHFGQQIQQTECHSIAAKEKEAQEKEKNQKI